MSSFWAMSPTLPANGLWFQFNLPISSVKLRSLGGSEPLSQVVLFSTPTLREGFKGGVSRFLPDPMGRWPSATGSFLPVLNILSSSLFCSRASKPSLILFSSHYHVAYARRHVVFSMSPLKPHSLRSRQPFVSPYVLVRTVNSTSCLQNNTPWA